MNMMSAAWLILRAKLPVFHYLDLLIWIARIVYFPECLLGNFQITVLIISTEHKIQSLVKEHGIQ